MRYFPYELLHKKWGYYLLSGLREFIDNEEIEEVMDRMWRRYPKGLVAHIKHVLSEAEGKGQVPERSEGLARYLAKYVVSPSTSIRRIISYDGEQVRYWYKGLS